MGNARFVIIHGKIKNNFIVFSETCDGDTKYDCLSCNESMHRFY